MQRKGYGIGRGQGYKNLIKGYDQHIHSQSSKGIKQPQRFKIFVRPEGEDRLRPTKVWFKDRKKAENFANIETAAGMGEQYFVKGGKRTNKFGWADTLTETRLLLTNFKGTEDYNRLPPKEKQRLLKLEKELKSVTTKSAFKKVLEQSKGIIPIALASGITIWGAGETSGSLGVGLAYLGLVEAYMVEQEVARHIKEGKSKFTKNLKKVRSDFPHLKENEKRELAIRMTYKGGKVPFNTQSLIKYDLPIETAIYVPSTDKNQKQIGKSQYQKRLKETEDFLSNLYGGFTRFDDIGGYKTLKKGIIKEKGARVVAFASKKDIKNKQKSAQLKNFILKKQKEWGQESIGYENEGDLHYLSAK